MARHLILRFSNYVSRLLDENFELELQFCLENMTEKISIEFF